MTGVGQPSNGQKEETVFPCDSGGETVLRWVNQWQRLAVPEINSPDVRGRATYGRDVGDCGLQAWPRGSGPGKGGGGPRARTGPSQVCGRGSPGSGGHPNLGVGRVVQHAAVYRGVTEVRPDARDRLAGRRQRQVRSQRPDRCVEAGPPQGQGLRSRTFLSQRVGAGEEVPSASLCPSPQPLARAPACWSPRGGAEGGAELRDLRGFRGRRARARASSVRAELDLRGRTVRADRWLRSPSRSPRGCG